MRWYRSIAVKSIVVAFVATHVPLLALVALVVLAPGWLSPLGVLLAALGATLMAAALATLILYRLFKPLQSAADGLRKYMTTGQPLALTPGAEDEVGRFTQVLVLALAHLDRSREPLLQAGGMALARNADSRLRGAAAMGVIVLLEADKWHELESRGNLMRMEIVQSSMGRMVTEAMRPGEIVLPWGRGRFMLTMQGPLADTTKRLGQLCSGFRTSVGPGLYSCSAAVEPIGRHTSDMSATLQKLEQKLFTLRLDGRFAQVA